jgi:hypothetical protein
VSTRIYSVDFFPNAIEGLGFYPSGDRAHAVSGLITAVLFWVQLNGASVAVLPLSGISLMQKVCHGGQ